MNLHCFMSDTLYVHHRDRIRDNNNIENLFLFPDSSSHHSFHHQQSRTPSITEEEFMKERSKI